VTVGALELPDADKSHPGWESFAFLAPWGRLVQLGELHRLPQGFAARWEEAAYPLHFPFSRPHYRQPEEPCGDASMPALLGTNSLRCSLRDTLHRGNIGRRASRFLRAKDAQVGRGTIPGWAG